MEPLRIGVAGAGAIAQRNAREAQSSGSAKIVGIFDVNHKVAKDMARALSAPFFPSYEALLANEQTEAVLLSTPHHLHRPMTVQAAKCGKHVLVEKPLANNLREAKEMLDVCRDNGVALTVNYSFRYLPKIQEAKRLVDQGALGDITGVQVLLHQFKDPGYWTGARSNSPDDWRGSREKAGGGFLIMTACHIIDYMYFITGRRAVRIYSEYATLGSPVEVEDIISVTCRFDNGAVGTVSASSIMRGMDQDELRVWGTKGSLLLNNDGVFFYSTRPVMGKRPGKVYKLAKFPAVSWTAEWVKDFVKAVREGKQPQVSGQDGWNNLAFITTAYDSLDRKSPLDVPPFIPPG